MKTIFLKRIKSESVDHFFIYPSVPIKGRDYTLTNFKGLYLRAFK
jgi:hypothetical protein